VRNFGFGELLLILAIVVLLFGAKRLPDVFKGVGEGIRGFKDAVKGKDEENGSTQPK
jgi:sec-independent protein translocase protein TatA